MDLYALLGLASGATPADIKRAYRRLARRYHPDINPGDRAAESLYKRISEAYETLVDPERRRTYDSGEAPLQVSASTFEFTGFDFSSVAHGAQAATFTELFADAMMPGAAADTGRPEPGADIHAAVTIEFEESIRGVERVAIGRGLRRLKLQHVLGADLVELFGNEINRSSIGALELPLIDGDADHHALRHQVLQRDILSDGRGEEDETGSRDKEFQHAQQCMSP